MTHTVPMTRKYLCRLGLLSIIVMSMLLLTSQAVSADPPPAAPPDLSNAPRLCQLVDIVRLVIRYAIAAGGLATFGMILFGGLQFLMAGANDGAIQQARSTITWALIGMVILFSSYFILVAISEFTGVDVTGFEYPWVGTVGENPCGV